MKTSPIYPILLVAFSLISSSIFAQVKVADGTIPNPITPAHPSAVLEVYSNIKGFLPPKLTTVQRDAIAAPADGLTVFNTTEDCINVFQGGNWQTYCNLRYSASCNCVEYLTNYSSATPTWIPVSRDAHDWYEVGATSAPDAITDDLYTQGKVGIGIATPTAGLHINHADGVIAQGVLGAGAAPLAGGAVKLVWSPKNAAFRAGRVTAAQWDDTNMGNYSTGFGFNTTANGGFSFASGHTSIASGIYSFANGLNTVASGVSSTAFGNGASATGTNSVAIGNSPDATGINSIAMGQSAAASSTNNVAIGYQTVASGTNSTAIGYQAEATGTGARAFGFDAEASGAYSSSLGLGTYSRSYGETAVGLFGTDYLPYNANGFDALDRAFCVGIGSSDAARVNALRIYKNGKSRFDGNMDIVTSTISADQGLYITNNGTASGQIISQSNVLNDQVGLYVRHTGIGEGARVRILNAQSQDAVLVSYNDGLGRGVYSTIKNPANTQAAVAAYNSGLGEAVFGGGTTTTGGVIGTNFRSVTGTWWNLAYNPGFPGIAGTTGDGIAGVAGSVWKLTAAELNNTCGGYFSSVYGTPGAGLPIALNYSRVSYITAGGALRKIDGPGAAGTVVTDLDEKPVLMTCVESPEILFTDYGFGELVNGKGVVKLDPIYTKNIIVDSNNRMKVFVQLEGDCKGVYVTNKTAEGFEVQELQGGTSNVTFSYEVVANRANVVRDGNAIIFDSSRRFEPGATDDMHRGVGRTDDLNGEDSAERVGNGL